MLACWLAGPAAAATDAIALLSERSALSLRAAPQVLVPRASVGIADLAAGRLDQRLAAGDESTARLDDHNELWVRLFLRNPLGRPASWHIDYLLPSIDEVTLYESVDGTWIGRSAGDAVEQSHWARSGRYPRFHVRFDAAQERLLFVRVRNAFPAPVALRAIEETIGDEAEQAHGVGLGIVFGALAMLAAACLVQAMVYRNASYFLYATYTTLMALSFVTLSGLAAEHVWGDLPRWNEASKAVFPLATAGVSVWLVRSMCRVSVRDLRLARFTAVVGWLVLATAVTPAVLGSGMIWVVGSAMLLAVSTVLFIGGATLRRGDPMGGWVLAAHLPLIAVTTLSLLQMFGYATFPFGFANFEFDDNFLLSLAIAAILPLLLVGLYQQSRELFGVQVRAREMASTDALTGLLASKLFSDRVRAAVGRWRKSGHDAAILYVRLVNAARIRELHGGAAVEQSLIRSAIKLRREMADADSIGRVDENTMGVILESVLSREAIMERCARLVAHGLMPLAGLKPNVTLQFHVAVAVLSRTPLDAAELQEALADLLGAMSPRTRRPIRFVATDPQQQALEAETGLGALPA